MMPVRNSSMFDVSVEVSSIVMADTEGVEIHDGGPSEVEYPCITLDMFPSRSCLVVLACAMGSLASWKMYQGSHALSHECV